MRLTEIYESLLKVTRPIEFFGKVKNQEELKKEYKKIAKDVHPDNYKDKDRYIASEAFSILNKLYKAGLDELKDGIYEVYDQVQIYKHAKSLFEITVKGELYKFYELVFEGEVADIYKGASENEIVYLKVVADCADNDLLDTEFKVLSDLRHQSLPYVEHKITINDRNAILMREVKGITMDELLKQYPKGVPAEHVMWMLERLLSVVGFLHSNFVVHGNLKPENIVINKEVHNVSLVGFSFCIPKANEKDAKYKIVNDYYTAPEVNKTARVLPASDIYSIGKIAIKLLGGDAINGRMPISVDPEIRAFIRKMINVNASERPKDAWELWSELVELRTKVFGTQRFKKLD